MGVPVAPHPCQHLALSVFPILAVLTCVLMVFCFNLHFLVDMLSIFATCISSLVRFLLRSWHFLLGCFLIVEF